MVLILGMLGSPRSGGNTHLALSRAMEGARSEGAETAVLEIAHMDISPCSACSHCSTTGECDVLDDMARVYGLLDRADGVIIATPIYFSDVTAQLKAAIDRCQCLWVRRELLGIEPPPKRGALIAVGGSEHPIFRNAVSVIRSFYRTIGAEYCGELLIAGVDAPGEIGEGQLERAFALGRELVRECSPV